MSFEKSLQDADDYKSLSREEKLRYDILGISGWELEEFQIDELVEIFKKHTEAFQSKTSLESILKSRFGESLDGKIIDTLNDFIDNEMINYAEPFVQQRDELLKQTEWILVSEHPLTKKTDCIFYAEDLRNPCNMAMGMYFPDQGFKSAGIIWKNVTHYKLSPEKPVK